MADMYVKGGSLNPFWVDEDIDRAIREEFKQDENLQEALTDGLKIALQQSIREVLACKAREYEENQEEDDEDDEDYLDELEAKFQFIKRHSDNPNDLELAKKILGID